LKSVFIALSHSLHFKRNQVSSQTNNMVPTFSDMKAKVEELDITENPDVELADQLKKGEARIVRKLDLCLMPVFMMLMLLGFLDRGNIGYAASQGMIKDINLKGKQLNVGSSSSSYAKNCSLYPI
jgi:hypothetical protein